MALTDLQLKQALPRERDYKISDGGGLYILVRPAGSKLWRMKYRAQGREKKLSLCTDGDCKFRHQPTWGPERGPFA